MTLPTLQDTADRLTDSIYFGQRTSGGGGSVTGSGTAGVLAKWASGSALTDSTLSESGGNLSGTGSLTLGFNLTAGGNIKGKLYDKGGQVFNIKAFGTTIGAVGVGNATADTAAIDAAWAAAIAAGGGIVYLPQGAYFYAGNGLVNYPGAAQQSIWLVGAGINTTKIVVNSVVNAEFIKMGSSTSTLYNVGGGVAELTIDATAVAMNTKDIIHFEGGSMKTIRYVYTRGGASAIVLGEGSKDVVEHTWAFAWHEHGIEVTADLQLGAYINTCVIGGGQPGGGASSGACLYWKKSTGADAGGLYVDNVTFQGETDYGVHVTCDVPNTAMFLFMSRCYAEGTWTSGCVRVVGALRVYLTDFWALAANAGFATIAIDGCQMFRFINGSVYNVTGPLFSLANSCLDTHIINPNLNLCPVTAFYTDGTSHTDTVIVADTQSCAAVSNDLTKLVPPTSAIHLIGGALTIGTAAFTGVHAIGNSGTNAALDWTLGNVQSITITNNWTPSSITAPHGPATLTLYMTHDGTASTYTRTLTGVKWAGGVAPTWTNTAGAVDIVTLKWNGTNYYGAAGTAFA